MDCLNYKVLDEKDFELKVLPDIKKSQINIFCSVAFTAPNYSIIFTLNELKKFVKDMPNYKIHLVLWDMSTLANPYFKKYVEDKVNSQEFIEQKMKELIGIAESVGFDKQNIMIYKSSELWKRLISFKEEDIFQEFYFTIAQMEIKNFVHNEKVSHLLRIPMDIFFCKHFHQLYPEDIEKPIDIAFFSADKERLYLSTRQILYEEGLILDKTPVFVKMDYFPYLMHNHKVPDWNMSLREIKGVISNFPLSKQEVSILFRFLNSKGNKEELAEVLHNYLQEHKKKFDSEKFQEDFINLSGKAETRRFGKILKSQIALDILLLADGTKNTTEISKKLGKSIATISTYTNRLKKLGFIKLVNGKIKRTLRGIKINFELGVWKE